MVSVVRRKSYVTCAARAPRAHVCFGFRRTPGPAIGWRERLNCSGCCAYVDGRTAHAGGLIHVFVGLIRFEGGRCSSHFEDNLQLYLSTSTGAERRLWTPAAMVGLHTRTRTQALDDDIGQIELRERTRRTRAVGMS